MSDANRLRQQLKERFEEVGLQINEKKSKIVYIDTECGHIKRTVVAIYRPPRLLLSLPNEGAAVFIRLSPCQTLSRPISKVLKSPRTEVFCCCARPIRSWA